MVMKIFNFGKKNNDVSIPKFKVDFVMSTLSEKVDWGLMSFGGTSGIFASWPQSMRTLRRKTVALPPKIHGLKKLATKIKSCEISWVLPRLVPSSRWLPRQLLVGTPITFCK